MTDGQLRGLVLQKLYDRRHQADFVDLSEIANVEPTNPNRIANICDQLGQHGLIQWTAYQGLEGVIAGMGKISANGVDVIEGTRQSPITVTLHDHRISVASSSHVQIGNANVQGKDIDIGKLVTAVDHSSASEAEKTEAKSILGKIAASPLVQGLLAKVGLGGTP